MPQTRTPWGLDDTKKLVMLYPVGTKGEITAAFPNRAWNTIKGKARRLNLKLSRACYKCDLSILLDKSDVSFYWLGFLCADANFTEHTVGLEISEKDVVHLNTFCNYINYPETGLFRRSRKIFGKQQNATLCAYANHKEVVQKLRNTYSISNNKTKNPIDISSMLDLELMCFFIGFIDGDGSICFRKNGSIVVSNEIDKSWFSILKSFELLLPRLNIITSVRALLYTRYDTRQTFARWQTSSRPVFYQFRQFAVEHHLPIMHRKWFSRDSSCTIFSKPVI